MTEQQAALKHLLLLFQGNGTIFDELLIRATVPTIKSEELVTIYTSVVQSIQQVVQGNMKEMMTKFEKLKTYLDELHAKETAQAEQESPESLLTNL